jgi:hypothetical protein
MSPDSTPPDQPDHPEEATPLEATLQELIAKRIREARQAREAGLNDQTNWITVTVTPGPRFKERLDRIKSLPKQYRTFDRVHKVWSVHRDVLHLLK